MFFKEKEPEPINNHVVRTIIEAKYTLKDLSLEEVTILRNLLSDRERSERSYDYYSNPRQNKYGELLAKIQL